MIEFAKSTGKPNIDRYVDGLGWTFRIGGQGLRASEDVIVNGIGCTTEEYAKIYELNKPVKDSFHSFCSMFAPFGEVSHGRKMIDEVLVVDKASKEPALSIQPMNSGELNNSVKIKVLSSKRQKTLERKVVYQVRKHNACRNCGKCDSVCAFDAIKIVNGTYSISGSACKRCQKCVTSKYLAGGCMMNQVLRTRRPIP